MCWMSRIKKYPFIARVVAVKSNEQEKNTMDNLNIPRLLTSAELTQIKANNAANKTIFEAAGWFVPVPDGRTLSEMGDKSQAYVDDARDILEQNQAELGALVPLAAFKNADDVHDQAQEIEDELIEILVAPTNVSLIAGAAAKKYADDEYNILKGLERVNTKWKAAVERLGARYKGQGPRPKAKSSV